MSGRRQFNSESAEKDFSYIMVALEGEVGDVDRESFIGVTELPPSVNNEPRYEVNATHLESGRDVVRVVRDTLDGWTVEGSGRYVDASEEDW